MPYAAGDSGQIAWVNGIVNTVAQKAYTADVPALVGTTLADPLSAAAIGLTATIATSLAAAAPVSVRAYGATGDGITLDTAAINAAIQANPGRTIYLPAGTYLINGLLSAGQGNNLVGIKLNVAKTRLLLDPGAIIKIQTNASPRYAAIEITAADCVVEGGSILGDVGTHTGTGEFGYGISVNSGGDRAIIRGIKITKCWGDGIIVGDGSSFTDGNLPTDVQILDVTCDDNRRQGLSVVASRRLRVVGGVFSNTGLTAYTGPGAGIDFEPNAGGLQDNIDGEVIGAILSGNKGRGFVAQANGRTNSVRVVGCSSVNNLDAGYVTVSTTDRTKYLSCTATGNALDGWYFGTTASHTEIIGCTSSGNTGMGFADAGVSNLFSACVAKNNAKTGFYLESTCVTPKLIGCIAVGNCTGAVFIREFEVFAVGARLASCHADVGVNTVKAQVGFGIRSGATGSVVTGCSAVGTFATAAYQGQADTFTFPIPGAAKPAAITAPTAPGAAYVQAEAAAMKTAVDAIRVALTALGITS